MHMKIPLVRSPPRNLCILRLSAIGDVTHVVPVVRTIQKHWPDTGITWIVGKVEHGLVGDIRDVDFIAFDKSGGWDAYRTLKRDLSGRMFDVLLDLQPSLRANIASRMIQSPVKLGFDRQRAKDFQWLFTTHRIEACPRRHVMDGFFSFLQALGIEERVLCWDIPIPKEAVQFARHSLACREPVLAINPCAKGKRHNRRSWNVEGYAAVADYAARKHGLRVVLSGGPSEQEMAFGRRIVSLCSAKPMNLMGKTNLKELLAVLDRAVALVAPDTGPAHMATAVGTPVIGLYATTNPMRARPYLSETWTVNRYPEALHAEYGLTVEQARWGKRVRNPDAMNRISVSDVTDKLDALVDFLHKSREIG